MFSKEAEDVTAAVTKNAHMSEVVI